MIKALQGCDILSKYNLSTIVKRLFRLPKRKKIVQVLQRETAQASPRNKLAFTYFHFLYEKLKQKKKIALGLAIN
jgi:hypothetical protein